MGVMSLFFGKKNNSAQFSSRLRLLFILPNLDAGGAERVILSLLNNLDDKKFDLHLAVVHYKGVFIRQLSPKIQVHNLKTRRVRKIFLPLLFLVYRLQPQIIISSLGYLNLVVIFLKSFFPSQTRVIVREASVLGEVLKTTPHPEWWAKIYRWLYPKANFLICQSEFIKEYLAINYGVPISKMVQIYNPVDIEDIRVKASQGENPFKEYGKGPHIVSAGRLSPEKGMDRLIKAFYGLSEKEPQAKLWILGQGKKREELKKIRDHLGLKEKVFFMGFQENPYVWFQHADLFVLASHFEGLPNALLEAIACGCPVVALHHPGGTEEILKMIGLEHRYVPSLESWKDSWWDRSSSEVIKNLNNNFSIIKISKKYEILFNQVLLKKV